MRAKVAIVTGSSRGIGRAVSFQLAREGINIVVNARKEKDVKETAQEIKKETRVETLPVVADIRVREDAKRLVQTTIKEFGQVDILVNNAGVAVVKTLEDTTDEEWHKVIDTNLKGVFYCCREVLPYMIQKRSGSIINISSDAGKSGFAQLSAYCASKFGVIGLTESLASEISQYGINVVAICPGDVATQMQKEFMTDEEYEGAKAKMTQPEDVAKKVLEAVKGRFRTGSSIDVY